MACSLSCSRVSASAFRAFCSTRRASETALVAVFAASTAAAALAVDLLA